MVNQIHTKESVFLQDFYESSSVRAHSHFILSNEKIAKENVMPTISMNSSLTQEPCVTGNGTYLPEIQELDVTGEKPSGRTQYAMCIDEVRQHVYLHGGSGRSLFSGNGALFSDLWRYSIQEKQWCRLSDGKSKSAPGGVSDHAICFDSKTNSIFVLGGFNGRADNVSSSFYQYLIGSGEWMRISEDMKCGSKLLNGHEMHVDTESRLIWVTGGHTSIDKAHGYHGLCLRSEITNSKDHGASYGGLYSYHIDKGIWATVREPKSVSMPDFNYGEQDEYSYDDYVEYGDDDDDDDDDDDFPRACRKPELRGDPAAVPAHLCAFEKYYRDYDVRKDLVSDESGTAFLSCRHTDFQLVFDRSAMEMYVFGGSWCGTQTSPTVLVYNCHDNIWVEHEIKNVGNNKYCFRFGNQAVLDRKSGSIFTFGGSDPDSGKVLNDFWVLQFKKLTQELTHAVN